MLNYYNIGNLRYKGYTGSVEYSAEDGCLYGKVQGLHGTLISYVGNYIEEIKEDFEGAIDDYVLSCEERGIAPAKPYSGKLNLRMSSELHAAIAHAVHSSGTTINDFINLSMSTVVHLPVAKWVNPTSHIIGNQYPSTPIFLLFIQRQTKAIWTA